MIDEFVARVKDRYQGLSTGTIGRVIGGMNDQTFKEFLDVLDVYGCAWYSIVSGPYGIPPTNILDRFYADIPTTPIVDDQSLASLLSHVKDGTFGFSVESGTWNHGSVSVDHIIRLFVQAAKDVKFEFHGWMNRGAAIQPQHIPLGLIAEKFLTPGFLNRHASNVGVILNWDASFIDIDNNKYKLMVIDRWPVIIERLMKRFGGDKKKLPRFCYGFNDFYLLRPVAVSILRDKQVPDEIYKWFCLWQFRRIWSTSPSDKLFAKAVCKSWERFREVIYQEGYKRSHLFNCLMRMLHELKEVPITREQLGDVYPVLIRAALKKNDGVAASFLQII
jgi:hypothetical protein